MKYNKTLLLTSLAFASANPPPRRMMTPHGNLAIVVFQSSIGLYEGFLSSPKKIGYTLYMCIVSLHNFNQTGLPLYVGSTYMHRLQTKLLSLNKNGIDKRLLNRQRKKSNTNTMYRKHYKLLIRIPYTPTFILFKTSIRFGLVLVL